MRILALDTSTEYLSLALLLDGKACSRDIHAGQTHSQIILPMIDELLREAGIALQELDGIAFGAGPGSFTGLRIGCGVAQGLAFGANLPVVGVSTLKTIAQGSGAAKVIACLDARMGEVYHAAYIKKDGTWEEVIPPGVYKPEAVPRIHGEGWIGAGNAWAVYQEKLSAIYEGQLVEALPGKYPDAISIARLSEPLFKAGLGVPAAQAAPVYIRNKVAFTMQERASQ